MRCPGTSRAFVLPTFKERYGLGVVGVSREGMRVLAAYHWPGNVRELEAVVEQAMIFQEGGWVRPEDLDLARGGGRHQGPAPGQAFPRSTPDAERLRVALRRQAALRLAAERSTVTRRDLSSECGISGEQARLELLGLARLRVLRRVGGWRGTRYVLA